MRDGRVEIGDVVEDGRGERRIVVEVESAHEFVTRRSAQQSNGLRGSSLGDVERGILGPRRTHRGAA